MTSVDNEKLIKSLPTMANAIELGAEVMSLVSGNEVGGALNGDTLTKNQLRSMLASVIIKELEGRSA